MCSSISKDQQGYYHNFIGNVEFHMDEPWYNIRDLLRVLRRMKKFDFSHPENRYKALCWLNGICCTVPYGPNTRFPYKNFYVSEARGCWGEILNQLKKILAENCMIKFEIGKEASSTSGNFCRRIFNKKNTDCASNTQCCSTTSVVCTSEIDETNFYAPHSYHDDNYCPITSDICDSCLGAEPPSCCPDWKGQCEVKKVPPAVFRNYLKKFTDIIEKMLKGIEKKDCVFSRKTFESHYKVVWKSCRKKCDILENDSDEDFICDECWREEQEQAQYCTY